MRLLFWREQKAQQMKVDDFTGVCVIRGIDMAKAQQVLYSDKYTFSKYMQ